MITISEKLSMTDTFLTLIPLNPHGRDAVLSRYNRTYVRHHLRRPSIDAAAGQACDAVASFGYHVLFGRRCLTFGASRSAQLTLPNQQDISDYHFTISYDFSLSKWVVNDISTSGIRLSGGPELTQDDVRQSQRVLESGTIISLGRDYRYQFRALLNRDASASNEAFQTIIEHYRQSLLTFSTPQMCAVQSQKRRRSDSAGPERVQMQKRTCTVQSS